MDAGRQAREDRSACSRGSRGAPGAVSGRWKKEQDPCWSLPRGDAPSWLPRHRDCQLPRVSRAQQLNSWRGNFGPTRVYSGAVALPREMELSRGDADRRPRRRRQPTDRRSTSLLKSAPPAAACLQRATRAAPPSTPSLPSLPRADCTLFLLFLTARPTVTPARVCGRGCPGCARGRFLYCRCAPSNGWLVWGGSVRVGVGRSSVRAGLVSRRAYTLDIADRTRLRSLASCWSCRPGSTASGHSLRVVVGALTYALRR